MQMRQVLNIINKIKKDDTSMNYYPKTAYWGPLVPNAQTVDKTTNSYFKNSRASCVVENEAWFGMV